MEKTLCASCGAAIVPNTTQPFLTCAYCDTAVSNPYYEESHAQQAAQPDLQTLCVQTLLEMGRSEKVDKVTEGCFGNPLPQNSSARDVLSIPAREKMYFLIDHLTLLGTVKEALALCDGGMYYKCDGETGHRSWETFVTGAIALTECDSWQESGTLTIGNALRFSMANDNDVRLARFLIDFHNRMYLQHTGSAAPQSWSARTEEDAAVEAETSVGIGGALGLACTVATLAKGLMNRTTPQRSIVQRPAALRTTRKPVVQRHQGHMDTPLRAPRPTPHQQHMNSRPAPMGRPGGRPGTMSRPGGMGGPGRGPGGRGGHGGPGGMGRR